MKKKLLIIGYVWPEPKSSAAGSRMLQLIEIFLSENYNITFASPCAKTENAFDLNAIDIVSASIKLNDSSFDEFIKELNPDVVLFDRFMMEEQFGWRVAEHCPDAVRILDTEDLHFLRKGRHQAFKNKKPFDKLYLLNDIAKREVASIYRCDLSLIISEVEMEILHNDFKVDASLLLYIPFMLDEISKDSIAQLPEFDERQHFITIGNFLHEPNYNAVLYLKETIWPLIRKELPKAELHVYGAYATDKVKQLHNETQRFFIKGFADDVEKVMQKAKVLVAPIRFGAGLKGKLIDAMHNGTPIVTTTIGAEGMFGDLMPNGFVEDTPEDFANACVKLYENKSLWKDKQLNGFDIINARFNKAHIKPYFVTILNNTLRQLHENRANNFTGQMLLHHTLQSTKYLGKWIEAKNKA
ncbi:glycosyltransferase [Hyunsoonleella pacifica]|uniref:Glycosyltransferase n=1 Tax=Hyunsoonleella pacifica TaxID=1080224 RepID=A0A4V2JAV7_9FLAO|nr:glycosyltransferase [Hyunsoonleella pacifica]TBN15385.1 glycosyltransferase [Hyunsoonleella pacifica]GGD23616.1 glycosyl transferase [Hyunsoonleella pacifica]